MPRWSAERRASLNVRGADASRKSVPRVPLATARNAVRPAHCAGSARTERLSALHPLAAGEGHTPSFQWGWDISKRHLVGSIADRAAKHCCAARVSLTIFCGGGELRAHPSFSATRRRMSPASLNAWLAAGTPQ